MCQCHALTSPITVLRGPLVRGASPLLVPPTPPRDLMPLHLSRCCRPTPHVSCHLSPYQTPPPLLMTAHIGPPLFHTVAPLFKWSIATASSLRSRDPVQGRKITLLPSPPLPLAFGPPRYWNPPLRLPHFAEAPPPPPPFSEHCHKLKPLPIWSMPHIPLISPSCSM
jgi:hypothetical protein